MITAARMRKEDNYALYLELNSKAAYQVDLSVSVTLSSGTYFDELVGISMGELWKWCGFHCNREIMRN